MTKYSQNNRAAEVCGKRVVDGMFIDSPQDFKYHCPNDHVSTATHWLEWSEYETFVWCGGCNKDYPTVLCIEDIDRATDVYLDCIKHVKMKANQQ